MPYDGGLSQKVLQERSAGVAQSIFDSLGKMDDYFEKVLSWADGRDDATLAQWIMETDKELDTVRFPPDMGGDPPVPLGTSAALEAFVADVRALASALNAISTGVSAGNRADIVKFA